MKKITTLFLVFLLTFCFTACNTADKDKTDTTKNEPETDTAVEEDAYGVTQEKYETMTAEDLLANIEDINNVTADEFIWLVSTYRFNPIDEDTLRMDRNITEDALYVITHDARPEPDTYLDALLASPYPQVRGYAVSSVYEEEDVAKCLELMETETDKYVLLELTGTLAIHGKGNPKVGEFLLKMADDEHAVLREKGVFGLTESIDLDGAVEKLIERMNDENEGVRRMACLYCTKLKDARVIEPLKAILDNPEEEEFHSECIRALINFWYDYPEFKSTNEEAYRITMDYFRKVPRTEIRPTQDNIDMLSYGTTTDAYIAWKEKATYFDTNELFDVMVDILKDENAGSYAREFTMDVIYAHTPERMDEVQSIVDGLTDDEAESLQSAYADIMAEE